MRFYTTILLFFISFSFAFGQYGLTSKYIVISLTIKGQAVYYDCYLEKNLFDSTTCLELKYDTIIPNEQTVKSRDKLYINLDLLKQPFHFSVKEFYLNLMIPDDNLCLLKNMNCFTDRSVKMINNKCTEDLCLIAIQNIKIENNDTGKNYEIPFIRIKIKN